MVARARPRASRSRANSSMSARRARNSWIWCCWHQPANWRRSNSYACRVRPLYPARNPANASRSVLVNTGVTGTRAVDGIVVAIGHLRGLTLRPRSWASRGPSKQREDLTVNRPQQSRQVSSHPSPADLTYSPTAPDRRVWISTSLIGYCCSCGTDDLFGAPELGSIEPRLGRSGAAGLASGALMAGGEGSDASLGSRRAYPAFGWRAPSWTSMARSSRIAHRSAMRPSTSR